MHLPNLSPKLLRDIAAFFFEGFNDEEASFYFNLPQNLIQLLRSGAAFKDVRRGVINQKRKIIQKVLRNKRLHTGTCWFLERRYPQEFSKPETQLGFATGTAGVTNNTLVVTAELAEAFIARSKPIEDELHRLLEERDQRSANASANAVNNTLSHSDSKVDPTQPTIFGGISGGISEPSLESATLSLSAKLDRSIDDRSDGHHQALRSKPEGDATPVPPAAGVGQPIPLSDKNLEKRDSGSNKLNISENIIKKKRGRPKKKS